MAEKNPNKLYEGIRDLQDNLEAIKDIVDQVNTKIKEILNDSNEFGGIIDKVFKEQLVKYFLPGVQKVAEPLDDLISNTEVPGSLKGLVVFLDSIPLAIIRQEQKISELSEPVVPEKSSLTEPIGSKIDELPLNASYQNPAKNVSNMKNHEEPLKQADSTTETSEGQESPKVVEESEDRKSKNKAYARFVEFKKKKDEEKGFIKKYQVIRKDSIVPAIGEANANIEDNVVFEFNTESEALNKALELEKLIYPEEKELFGTVYEVKEIKVPTSNI